MRTYTRLIEHSMHLDRRYKIETTTNGTHHVNENFVEKSLLHGERSSDQTKNQMDDRLSTSGESPQINVAQATHTPSSHKFQQKSPDSPKPPTLNKSAQPVRSSFNFGLQSMFLKRAIVRKLIQPRTEIKFGDNDKRDMLFSEMMAKEFNVHNNVRRKSLRKYGEL